MISLFNFKYNFKYFIIFEISCESNQRKLKKTELCASNFIDKSLIPLFLLIIAMSLWCRKDIYNILNYTYDIDNQSRQYFDVDRNYEYIANEATLNQLQ